MNNKGLVLTAVAGAQDVNANLKFALIFRFIRNNFFSGKLNGKRKKIGEKWYFKCEIYGTRSVYSVVDG